MGDTLRTISMAWSLVHALVIFMILYEPRLSRKGNVIATAIVMGAIAAGNVVIFALYGREVLSMLMTFTVLLPSVIFFYFMAKNRGTRFVFTFCIVRTVSLAIIISTAMVDIALFGDSGVFSFVSRLILYPVVEIFMGRWLRKIYHELQNSLEHGWGWFAVECAICYLLLAVMMNYPVFLADNIAYFPAVAIALLLLPVIYGTAFKSLIAQKKALEHKTREDIFHVEKGHMRDIITQADEIERRVRIERHDLRHRLRSILTMLEDGSIEEAKEYIRASSSRYDGTRVEKLCQNPILDAVLSTFFADAKKQGIEVRSELAIPHELPVDATDLSIVFANALENAINAASRLPEGERHIKCRYKIGPHHMIQISNTYEGEVEFDERGYPVSHEAEHGIGTRSIAAFCERYGALLSYKAEDGWFHVRIML